MELTAAIERADLRKEFNRVKEGFKRDLASVRDEVTANLSRTKTDLPRLRRDLDTSAHGASSKTNAPLDHSIPRTLINATNHITQNFSKIFEN
jgi:hypothetical protein